MKKRIRVRVLIFALPLLGATTACAAPASAPAAAAASAPVPDKEPIAIERHIETRTIGSEAIPHKQDLPPLEPVTFLGLEVEPADETVAAQLNLPPDHGLVVRLVVPDSPAAQAGLAKNDVLVKIDDQVLIAPRQLSALVRSHKEGDTVKLTYIRGGSEARASASLVKRVPPREPMLHEFRWQHGNMLPGMPAHRQFSFRFGDDESPGTGIEEGHALSTEPGIGTPNVVIYRPKARIIYTEGDVTLQVTTDEDGRQLEACDADGGVIFSGPITTPEQRAAVPATLHKHLEKLDALEPSEFHLPMPPRVTAPPPSTGHTTTLQHATPARAAGADILFHPLPAGSVPAGDVLIHSTAI